MAKNTDTLFYIFVEYIKLTTNQKEEEVTSNEMKCFCECLKILNKMTFNLGVKFVIRIDSTYLIDLATWDYFIFPNMKT